MSESLFPILYLNMAGEMMYVLEQRLRVQKENFEDREQTDEVLKSIILAILSRSTLDEVFRARGLPSKKSLKILYEKLAHSSCMRLNDNSMDKLFDLMTMSTKYEFQQVVMAEQLMTVTVNHLQGFLQILPNDANINEAVEHTYTMIFSLYRSLTPYAWHMIRCALLVFFQDTRVKISLLLRENRQLNSGHFLLLPDGEPVQLPKDGEPVGITRYFENSAVTHSSEFPAFHEFVEFVAFPDALNVPQRSTKLGVNMYKNVESMKIFGGGGTAKFENVRDCNEMAFFETILSTTTTQNVGELSLEDNGGIIGMSLFDNDNEESAYVKDSEEMSGHVLRIDAAAKKKSLSLAVEEKIKTTTTSAAVAATAAAPSTTTTSSRSTEKRSASSKKSRGANMLDMMDEAAARPPTAKPKKTSVTRRDDSTTTTSQPPPRSRSGSRASSAAASKRAASAKRKS